MTNNKVGVYSEVSETSPGAEAYASPVTGWIVSTGAGPHWSGLGPQLERAATSFTGTQQPDGSIDTTNGDAWRTLNSYSGTFAAANWEFHGAVRANTNGGTQDGSDLPPVCDR